MAERRSVAIVGAGITGLSCAAALRHDAAVTVVDRIPVAGGVHGWKPAETRELVAVCGATLALGETALRWDGRELLVIGQHGAWRQPADALVIASGARPLGRPELGVVGSRPAGVVAATVACHLAENGLAVGLNPVIMGGGDWAMAASRRLLAAGARAITLVSPGPLLRPAPDDRRVAVREGERVAEVIGRGRICAVQLASGTRIECDALVLAHGLVPLRNVDGAVWDGHRTVYAQPTGDPATVHIAKAAGSAAAAAVRSLLDLEDGR